MHPSEMSFLYTMTPTFTMATFRALSLPEEFIVRPPTRGAIHGKIAGDVFVPFDQCVVESVFGDCVWAYEVDGAMEFAVYGRGNAYFPRNHGAPLMYALELLTGSIARESGSGLADWRECSGCSACSGDHRTPEDRQEIALRRACRVWTGSFSLDAFQALLASEPTRVTQRERETLEGYLALAGGPDVRLVDRPMITMMRAVLNRAKVAPF